MSGQIPAVFGQEVESDCRSVSATLVEQQTLGCTARAVLAPLLQNLEQAIDRLPVLERNGGYMARFREEARHHLICNALRSLAFDRRGTWEDPHSQLLLSFGIVLKNPGALCMNRDNDRSL